MLHGNRLAQRGKLGEVPFESPLNSLQNGVKLIAVAAPQLEKIAKVWCNFLIKNAPLVFFTFYRFVKKIL